MHPEVAASLVVASVTANIETPEMAISEEEVGIVIGHTELLSRIVTGASRRQAGAELDPPYDAIMVGIFVMSPRETQTVSVPD